MRERISWAVALAVLLVAALWLRSPPAALPADAPGEVFSSARALEHVRVVAKAPHPCGSAAHAAVRRYLVETLRALGTEPRVQVAEVVRDDWPAPWRAATVHNVFVRLQGTEGERAVLVAAHYDSVPLCPGAADDGAAVGAMLEAIRVLHGERHRNDLVFLFSDAEEVASLGAIAFVEDERASEGIAVALNFEARGAGGPALLFGTSDGNGRLVEAFAEAAPRPLGSSFAAWFSRRMPHFTDLDVLRAAGIDGLNFAFVERPQAYHTARDDPASLDPRSLQHHGETMLALARRFADADLADTRAPDLVYFDVLGSILVRYPASWVRPAQGVAGILLLLLFGAGLRRGRIDPMAVVRSTTSFALVLVGAAIAGGVVWQLVILVHPGYRGLLLGLPDHGGVYLAALAACAMCVVALGARLVPAALPDRVAAISVALLILGFGMPPALSYVVQIPLLFQLAAFALLLRGDSVAAAGVAALPAALLGAPLLHDTWLAVGPAGAFRVAAMAAFLAILTVPCLEACSGAHFRRAPAALLGVAVLLLGIGSSVNGFDAAHRRPEGLAYLYDDDAKTASWAAENRPPDAWTARFVGEGGARPVEGFGIRRPLRAAAAPAGGEVPAPAVQVLDDTTRDGIRTVRMRISSRRGAPHLHVEAKGAVRSARVAGRDLDTSHGFAIDLWGAAPEIRLAVPAGAKLRLRVSDRTYGIPLPAGPRPDRLMSAPFGYGLSDMTIAARTVEF